MSSGLTSKNIDPPLSGEARFQKIFNYSNDAIFFIDLMARKILDVNPKACRMLGYSREELQSMPIEAIHPSGMLPKIMAFSKSVMECGQGWTNELTCRTKSGRELASETSASVVELSGRPCMVAMVRDITARKQAEAALRSSEDRLSHILKSAMDAIVTFDASGRILLFNRAAEQTFQTSADQVLGRPLAPFLSEDLSRFLGAQGAAAQSASAPQASLWIPEGFVALRSDGTAFPIEASLSHVEVGGERLQTLILRDIKARQETEENLKKARLANRYLQEEIQHGYNFGEIIGKSGAIKKVMSHVGMVAGTDALVLVTGETGTGKELIARAVHHRSARRERPLIKVNCTTFPTGLIESELFGHEKGAFTGAISRKVGRFELADGGTLFLDEIGDLPLELQPKLLRVLQEGEFERVGGTETLKVDVRVIAATNRNLKQLVDEGRFRADLYYRLHVFPVVLPPLRERKGDISLLTQYFLEKCAKRLGRHIDRIDPETLTRLQGYAWPGNIRELGHVIERAVILSRGPVLKIEEELLPVSLLSEAGPQSPKSLEAIEREHIVRVLKSRHWVIEGPKGAAKVLDLHPNTLRSRMQRLGIRRESHEIS